MTKQLKSIIYLYLLVSFLSSPNIAFALDESGPELIWKIGDDEAPPDYTEKAFDEFDCEKPFSPHYYVHTDPYSKFPQGINDAEFTQIYIHYNLTCEQANKTLGLLLDTLYATHDSGVGRIPDYNMRISVKPPGRNWIEIGEFKFASSPPNGDGPEEQFIVIDNSYLGVGENIILLEDANPKLSWHWLNWDSIKLEAATPTATAQPATGFREEPYVVFQPVNTKITEDAHGSVELYMANPDVNDVVLHVSATIHTPQNLYLHGSFGGVTGATGVVTAKYDIEPGSHKTVKALIQPTRTGVYRLGCYATYYPVGHKELASDISSIYEMTVEGIPTVTPTPEPTPVPTSGIPSFDAMFVIASVLGVFYLLMRQK